MRFLNTIKVLLILSITAVSLHVQAQFAKGADVSWVTQQENSGYKWYNNSGVQQDLFTILKGKGMNTIRLRVWLDPWEGWCGKQDVIAKAVRAKNAGFRIMIDFHYSDYWADPGQQAKPAAWSDYSFTQLTTAVYNHTVDVLTALKSNGVTVEWVQVGNETNDGLLWEDGRASSNMRNYAYLINAGYDGTKAVFPSAKVIVHVSNGWDNGLFRWNFDGLKNNGAKWDVIGMSLYPTRSNWQSLNSQCLANMKDMVARYGKQVMVVEVGMEARLALDCKNFLIDLMNKTASIPNGNGLGVLYWEPQTYGRWQGYTKGAFDDKGRPTIALDAFSSVAIASAARSATDPSAQTSEKQSFRIESFPNPVTSELTLRLPPELANGADVRIYDYSGKAVIEKNVRGYAHRIDVSAIHNGLYIVKVNNGQRQATGKFMKE
ncbi:MAG TPA: glycosyl hydrolase 53 family protein [Chryseosolibacter sp.]|nr:glycosyl hydrolase 53 family protein [Chryseosolibacter sp.]